MKIKFEGAAKTVTGSRHLIEANGYRILLDCGMFQGKRKEAFELNRQCFCDGEMPDVIVLSHAHIDHSGNIPSLTKKGFQGDIICTAGTRDLCAAMLMDSAHIQERDVEFVNRRRIKQGKNPFEPLYMKEDVIKAMECFVGINYNRRRQILPGVALTFVDAGHMLGSTHVILDIEDKHSGQNTRVVFSGDIGRPDIPIIRDPQPITEGTDILIMESTYGNRLLPPYPETEKELKRIIRETFKRGGTLLIPSFAVGRTQQLVYALHKLYNNEEIPPFPIYVDSPLATSVTDIFRLHPETYDKEMREFLLNDKNHNPFGFNTMHYTQTVGESKELNTLKGPAIIMSASGMMESGRILHHLRNRITDSRNTILITGWQAPNTLGRRIVERQPIVKIFGEEYPLKAQVEILTGFSGHADREGLLAWASVMKKKPKRTFIVHGEEEAATELAESLRSEVGFERVEIPEMHQVFEVQKR